MAQNAIVNYKIVTIGGSAGSLDTILKIIPALSVSPNTTIIIVVHRKNDITSILEDLLSKRTHHRIKEVEDKDALLPGWVYIAPPDYHLLLEDQTLFSLDSSEKVHHSRPSIDVTFESVAEVFGPQAIGILLSGANEDGAEGLSQIKKAGGFTIVQDPSTAEVDYMPRQALQQFTPDAIVAGNDLPGFIRKLF